jgi:hypothetical protein
LRALVWIKETRTFGFVIVLPVLFLSQILSEFTPDLFGHLGRWELFRVTKNPGMTFEAGPQQHIGTTDLRQYKAYRQKRPKCAHRTDTQRGA